MTSAMRTVFINRPPGQYRQVPVTAPRGSGQLPARLADWYRATGLMAPRADRPAPPPKPPHVVITGHVRCQMHGLVVGTRCPSGCSRSFQDPVFADDADLPPVQKRGAEYQLVPKPVQTAEDVGELAMAESELRATLKRVLSHCPWGSKKPLARVCGYRGKWALHTLRGVAQGRAMLPEAVRCRLSAVLRRILRGEVVLVGTGQCHTAGRPSMSWVRADSAAGRNSRVSFTP